MQVILKEPAVADIREIYVWYESQKAGLGEEFLEDFDLLLPYLENYPQSFSIKYKKLRAVSLARFPFLVYYQISSKTIYIHRISHQKRNQRKISL